MIYRVVVVLGVALVLGGIATVLIGGVLIGVATAVIGSILAVQFAVMLRGIDKRT